MERTEGGVSGTHSLRRSVFVSFAVSCSVVAVVLLLALSLFYQSSVLNDAKGMLARDLGCLGVSGSDDRCVIEGERRQLLFMRAPAHLRRPRPAP